MPFIMTGSTLYGIAVLPITSIVLSGSASSQSSQPGVGRNRSFLQLIGTQRDHVALKLLHLVMELELASSETWDQPVIQLVGGHIGQLCPWDRFCSRVSLIARARFAKVIEEASQTDLG